MSHRAEEEEELWGKSLEIPELFKIPEWTCTCRNACTCTLPSGPSVPMSLLKHQGSKRKQEGSCATENPEKEMKRRFKEIRGDEEDDGDERDEEDEGDEEDEEVVEIKKMTDSELLHLRACLIEVSGKVQKWWWLKKEVEQIRAELQVVRDKLQVQRAELHVMREELQVVSDRIRIGIAS